MNSYSYTKQVGLSFKEALEKTKQALAEEGFGVLTQIDVKQTVKDKLGKDVASYQILGACNPQFAHQALEKEKEIGLLLPCNVIVYSDGGFVYVSTIRPTVALSVTGTDTLQDIAKEVEERLIRAVDSIT